ncbi:MAG TPA: glycosyltransferase, partial [Tepidisphaeraceae bacterium]|nr:glycosyltransferase [Tepidisphaeraceae bacterium]
MRILLITIGSHGDVHPFVGLAQVLKKRGHEVRLMTSPYFQSLIERAGIDFLPIGTAEQFAKSLDDPLLFHPRKGPKRVAQIAAREMETAFDPIVIEAKWADVVVGSSLSVSGLIASEVFGFPYVTVHLSPMCAPSVTELPTLRNGLNISRWPMPIKRTIWKLAERFMADPMFGPAINRMRAKHGLKPVRSIISSYWHAPRLTIGLWPEWFASKQVDHPRQLELAGFPLYDEADVTPLDSGLSKWLDEGDAPIAFTPGTA